MAMAISQKDLRERGNWMESAAALDAAMTAPASHGFAGKSDVLAAAARIRGKTETSLRQDLAALRFLERRFPQTLSAGDARIGSAHALLLERLDRVAPDLAPDALEKTLRGEMSRSQLSQVLRRARDAGAGVVDIGAHARGRELARRFEDAFAGFLRERQSLFSATPLTIGRDVRVRGLRLDIALLSRAGVETGVEICFEVMRPHRQTFHGRALQVIAMNALVQRVAPIVYTVLPWSDQDLASYFRRKISQLDIDDQHVVLFDEEAFANGDRGCFEIWRRDRGDWLVATHDG
jgi:hypothetical protein